MQVPELIEEYSQSLEEIMATQVPEGSAESGDVCLVYILFCKSWVFQPPPPKCPHPNLWSSDAVVATPVETKSKGDVIEHLMQKDNKMMNLVTQVRGEGLLGLFQEVR